MLEATQQPLGQTIHHIYRSHSVEKSGEEVWYAPVKEEVDAFVKELIRTVPEKGIDEAAEALKGKAFELRIRLFGLLAIEDAFKGIQDLVTDDVNSKAKKLEKGDLQRVDQEMAETYLEGLKTYLKIAQGSVGQIGGQSIAQATEELDSSSGALTYEDFRDTFLKALPYSSSQALLGFLDSSLIFEVGLLTADLSLEGTLRLSNKEKKAVPDLLFRSIEEMGVNASYLGIWEPDEGYEEQIVRNIKIRNAHLASQNEEQEGYTLEELKKALDQGPST